ncbi:Uncharacterised protein [Candidatus Gugararchaeum adminiculabundum]|nr:Uncharacterised protein [Candidatus Gugararchaeum adminiculabundum]
MYQRFSMGVSSPKSANSCGTTPILARTNAASSFMSKDATRATPSLGVMSVVSIFMVVVLPAPFGPRKPKSSPFFMRRSMPSTAVKLPNFLVRPVQSIAYSVFSMVPTSSILHFLEYSINWKT